MQGDVIVTVVGNVVNDPEIRYTQSGVAVINFTVATNPRRFNKQSNQWEDGDATFYRTSAWRTMAENAAESINKGDRVVVVGALSNRRYETRDGGVGYSLEITADEVALSTKWAIVSSRRPDRQQGGQQAPVEDPWASAAPSGQAPARGPQRPAQPQQGGQGDIWGGAPGGQGSWQDEPPF